MKIVSALLLAASLFSSSALAQNASGIKAEYYNHKPITLSGPVSKASGRVVSLCFDNDGLLLARGDVNKNLDVFSLPKENRLWGKKGDGILPVNLTDIWPLNLLFAAQGEFDGSRILVLEWNTGKIKGQLPNYGGGRNAVAFHPAKAEVAWVDPQAGLYRFGVTGGKYAVKGERRHKRPAYGLAYSGDARRLFSVSPDKSAVVWDTATGAARMLLTAQRPLIDVAAPRQGNSNIVVIGENRGLLYVLNGITGAVIKKIQIPDNGLSNLDFHPFSSDLLLVAGKTHVYFLQVSTGKFLREIDTGDRIHALAISKDGNMIATGHESGAVRFFKMQ
jgi:WD40 repeat protein